MIGTRAIGQSHIYLDKTFSDYSNVAVGLLIRAIGHGLKVAYVDCEGKSGKFRNFLENLSLNIGFVKSFDRLHIETFTLKTADRIEKCLIPLVEFNTMNSSMFWKNIENFDLVIFDNASFEKINKMKMLNYTSQRNPNQETVFVFSNENEFNEIKDNFDLVSSYETKSKKNLISNGKIICLTGDGKGKSTYSFGYLVRNFIEKKDVKLIYFDKGGKFYGERVFFNAIKKWAKTNYMYGTFDYAVTGLERFDGKRFRFDNVPDDVKEAKEGLMLLKTAIKKQTPVIADEINTTVGTGLLTEDEIIEVLKEVKNELLISGRFATENIKKNCEMVIEIKEIKHYVHKGQGVRKGIDF